MAYWNSIYDYRNQRLVCSVTVPEDIRQEVRRLEKDLDYAKAEYSRACAWAWPYANLRPLACEPGLEPATILNPFIPVPVVHLSAQSPDGKKIVAALNYWEPRVQRCEERLKDLLENQKAGAPGRNGLQPPGKNEDRPPEDPRLAKMFEIHQRLKAALGQWRDAHEELGALCESQQTTKRSFTELQNAADQLRREIFVTEQQTGAIAAGLRGRLAGMMSHVAIEQEKLVKMESQGRDLQHKQVLLFQEADAPGKSLKPAKETAKQAKGAFQPGNSPFDPSAERLTTGQ